MFWLRLLSRADVGAASTRCLLLLLPLLMVHFIICIFNNCHLLDELWPAPLQWLFWHQLMLLLSHFIISLSCRLFMHASIVADSHLRCAGRLEEIPNLPFVRDAVAVPSLHLLWWHAVPKNGPTFSLLQLQLTKAGWFFCRFPFCRVRH